MLLSNNNEPLAAVVYRRPKHESGRRRDKGLGGSTSARNSWSFTVEPPGGQQPVQCANINLKGLDVQQHPDTFYVDAEALVAKSDGKPQSVSRSRLRQRSTSNLAPTAGVRSRDQSSSSKQGTVSKGVDYIRINQPTLRVATVTTPPSPNSPLDPRQEIQDRSEYGNPDGSSAHSTAEREAGLVSKTAESSQALHSADLCQVINQNQSNDFKSKRSSPALISPSPEEAHPTKTTAATVIAAGDPPAASLSVRLGSGRGSARFTSKSAEMNASRKSTAAVKTEWTFLPSATAAATGQVENHETNLKPEESSLVRKGLLWVMRDRLFSRWHERYCILTHNYLHCFKKGSETNQLTQMGNFLFKVNLAEVTAVQWLDKRGTAIVCLSLAKEGRLLVKTSHDLNGWFQDFQNCVKDTRGRRQTLLERGGHKNGPQTDSIVPVIMANGSSSSSGPVGVQRRQPNQNANVIQPVALREKTSQVSASKNRQVNRFSLMSDVEVKVATSSVEKNDSLLSSEHQLLNNGTPAPPPVPVPYRERSVSFDRSRASSKAEREVKRRSYYPNHVTQV